MNTAIFAGTMKWKENIFIQAPLLVQVHLQGFRKSIRNANVWMFRTLQCSDVQDVEVIFLYCFVIQDLNNSIGSFSSQRVLSVKRHTAASSSEISESHFHIDVITRRLEIFKSIGFGVLRQLHRAEDIGRN